MKVHNTDPFLDGGWKKTKSICAIVIISAFLVSCNSSNKDKKTSLDDVKKEMKDVIDVSKDYGTEKWDDLINELKKDIDASTETVVENYKNLSTNLQNKFKDQKQKIANEKAELDKKLKEFQNASGKKKEALKSEIVQLKTALDKSISKFEKEMEKSQN